MSNPYRVKVNIYDTLDKSYTAKNISLQEAAKVLNTSYQNISRLKVSDRLYKNRYKLIILGNEIKENENTEHDVYAWKWEFEKKWDEARYNLNPKIRERVK